MIKLLKIGLKALGILREIEGDKAAGKMWYKSETIWTNIVIIIALVCHSFLGFTLSAEEQAAILTIVNVTLRLVTKEPIAFTKKGLEKIQASTGPQVSE